MKVLVGYDGSEAARATILDLNRAGLPDEAEVCLLAVVEVWPELIGPEPSEQQVFASAVGGNPSFEGSVGERPAWGDHPQRLTPQVYGPTARELALGEFIAARDDLSRALSWARATYPHWNVTARVVADTPHSALVSRARDWNADLLVLGARGQSILERMLLGSTSHAVLGSAGCSVRIGRAPPSVEGKSDASPPRLLIGHDGSSSADAAIDAVGSRNWPAGALARVVTALPMPIAREWADGGGSSSARTDGGVVARGADASRRLGAAGVQSEYIVRAGHARTVLVEEAAQWPADCIFLGTRGRSALLKALVGSVAVAVCARAGCSVEVVRPPMPAG